jgi:hypothetical protein
VAAVNSADWLSVRVSVEEIYSAVADINVALLKAK